MSGGQIDSLLENGCRVPRGSWGLDSGGSLSPEAKLTFRFQRPGDDSEFFLRAARIFLANVADWKFRAAERIFARSSKQIPDLSLGKCSLGPL